MRAIGVEQFGGVEALKEFDAPLPQPSRREVRIRIRAVGFNPVDTKIRSGLYGGKLPLILGSDCSGVVDAVGDPQGEFSIGDEVCALIFGHGSNGTYAEYVSVPTAFVVKKPQQLSFEQAASIPLVGLTAFQALIANGALQVDRPLFIAGGAGGVGTLAIQLARVYKAGPIVATAGSEESADYLANTLHLPRKQILLYKGMTIEQMEKRAIELNNKERFATALDTVGGEMKKLCLRVADVGGHVATILPEQKGFDYDLWMRNESPAFEKSLSIHFVFLGSMAQSEKTWNGYKVQLKALMQLFERRELAPPKVEVLQGLSVENVRKAHLQLESKHTQGKLVLLNN